MLKKNKLNQVLYCQREKNTISSKSKLISCPFCDNRNEQCNYRTSNIFLNKDDLTGKNSIPIEDGVKAEEQYCYCNASLNELLKNVIQILNEQATLMTNDEVSHLIVGYRRIDIRKLTEEIPLVNNLVWPTEWQDETGNTYTSTQLYFSSLVMQHANFNLKSLNKDSRDKIIERIREETARQGYYPKLMWIPVKLNGDQICDQNEETASVEAIELLDKELLCRYEEIIYRRLADLEEKMLAQIHYMVHEVKYPCSDLLSYREILKQEIQAIVVEIRKEVF